MFGPPTQAHEKEPFPARVSLDAGALTNMAPKKAAAAAEPEPEPEPEAPPEPEEGEGIFYFPDNSKYGAPSTACVHRALWLCLCAHCMPVPASQRASG